MTRLHAASLWVGYLGLGVGSLRLLFNPQKDTCPSRMLGEGLLAYFNGILEVV